jgi:hypothetical protein
VAQSACLPHMSFEPMLHYPLEQTEAAIEAAARVLDRPREQVLEDMGTYLVSHPNVQALRRLLRFGGVGFTDFLQSLEDLRGRGRLALPDLELPVLDLAEHAPDRYTLRVCAPVDGAGHVMLGLLRAMADDYGALVTLDYLGSGAEGEEIAIHLLDMRFSSGRPFDLVEMGG